MDQQEMNDLIQDLFAEKLMKAIWSRMMSEIPDWVANNCPICKHIEQYIVEMDDQNSERVLEAAGLRFREHSWMSELCPACKDDEDNCPVFLREAGKEGKDKPAQA